MIRIEVLGILVVPIAMIVRKGEECISTLPLGFVSIMVSGNGP